MTTQRELFSVHREDLAAPVPLAQGRGEGKAPARKTDPESSKEAGEKMSRGAALAQEALCEGLVYQAPGSTIHELAALSARQHGDGALNHIQIARRLPYIKTVEALACRKCKVSGAKCQTWWPKDEQ